MKLAISSIAWAPANDDDVSAVLREEQVDAVEVAPSAYWPDPLAAPRAERLRLRNAWATRGCPIVALQSLVFGFPELQLFREATREALQDRLMGMLQVAADLGARALVFGAPKNRQRGRLSQDEAMHVAIQFFRQLGEKAAGLGVVLCIEPNPRAYGCDFVTNAAEGRELVERVGSIGFRLHLDTAAMALAGDDATEEVTQSAALLGHFHFSAPELAPVRPGCGVDLERVSLALRSVGYPGYVSIEMRAGVGREEQLDTIGTAVRTVRALLGRES